MAQEIFRVTQLIASQELCNTLVGGFLVEFDPEANHNCGMYLIDKIARAESIYGCLHIWMESGSSFFTRGGRMIVDVKENEDDSI